MKLDGRDPDQNKRYTVPEQVGTPRYHNWCTIVLVGCLKDFSHFTLSTYLYFVQFMY